MGASAWPEEEISPQNERLLLEVACLRPFGVNYLEGAICPELGLLAHPHGSSVFLLPFCPVGDITDVSPVACAAKIDVQRRRSKPPSAGGYARHGDASALTRPVRGLSWTRGVYTRREGSTKGALAARGAAAGEVKSDETRCTGGGLQDAADVLPEVFGHLAVACGSDVRLWKVSRFTVGGAEGEGAAGGRGFRYATNEVLTEWGVPVTDIENTRKLDGDGDGDGIVDGIGVDVARRSGTPIVSAAEGSRMHRKHEETAPSEHCGGGARRQGRGSVATRPAGEYGSAVKVIGNVRCLSFRPVRRRGARVESGVVSEDEAAPLAAWYDTGAAMLGNGSSPAILPAPVAKKRACGAWSGCGRRLAVSSGGEVRVYTDPVGQISAATVDSPDRQPPVAREVWTSSGRRAATGENDGVVLARGERGSLSGNGTVGHSRSEYGTKEVGVSDTRFHTVLCAEAAVQGGAGGIAEEGGVVYSPCSSPQSSPDTRATARRPGPSRLSPSPPRPLHDASQRPPASDTAPSDAPSATSDREQRGSHGSHAFSNHSKTSVSRGSVSRLIGDIRSMCPAGPEAFFGATDAGLGLRSLVCPSGSFSNCTTESGSGMHGDSLLGAIVNDSTVRAAAMDAAEAFHSSNVSLITPTATTVRSSADGDGGADGKNLVVRRGGFRHVLPGENWLAGSLRPRSRDPLVVPTGEQLPPRGDSPVSDRSSPSSCSSKTQCATEQCAPLVVSEALGDALATAEVPQTKVVAAAAAVSDGSSSSVSAVVTRTWGGHPRPSSTATTQVLDLRGKLGGGVFSGTGNAVAAAQQHPLFRLSFDTGLPGPGMPDAAVLSGGKNGSITRDGQGSGGGRGGVHGGDLNRSPSQRPWLVRVTCSNSSGTDSTKSASDVVGGVKVQALASLPLALASPDLLASSEDGRFVAVGSHACGLVACYLVSSQPRVAASECVGADFTPATRISLQKVNGKYGGGVGKGPDCFTEGADREVGVGSEGARSRRKRRPRAMPVCTLRLPPGYKAKGLVFVGRGKVRKRTTSDVSGSGSTGIGGEVLGAGGKGDCVGATNEAADDDFMGKGSDETVLLVLAACPVDSVNASSAYGSSKKSASQEAPPLRGSHGEGSPFRTVLLRFLLPKSITSCSNDGEKHAGCATSASFPPTLAGKARELKEQNQEAALQPLRVLPGGEGRDRSPMAQQDARADGYAHGGIDECSHSLPRRSVSAKAARKHSESCESAAGESSVRREAGGEVGDVAAPKPGSSSLSRQRRTMVPPLTAEKQSLEASGCGKARAHSGLSASSPLRGESMAGSSTAAVGLSFDDSADGFVETNFQRRPSVHSGAVISKEDEVSVARYAGTDGGSSAELPMRAAILGAIEGVEKRMGQRLDGIERMLHGVCERVESLERAVVNNQ